MSEFRVCPSCGYTRGFHVCFADADGDGVRIGLICPSCGHSYDLGWVTRDIPGTKAEAGPVYGDRD
jgi:hypothetical protein